MVLQLVNPMEIVMLSQFFSRLLSAMAQARVRKCARTMLQLDDYILRDIGLTQNDVVQCLGSQPHKAEGCLPASRTRNLETSAPARHPSASAPAGHLAA